MTMGDSSGVKRPLMVRAFFVSLVLSVFVGPRVTRWLHAGEPAGEYGFRFEESARALGIDFVHEVTPPDTLIDNLGPWIQGVVTASAAVCDVNEDLLVHKYGSPELFRNQGDGTFTRVTREAGLETWIYANDALWWDFNRDGCLDLCVPAYYRPEHNFWRLNETRILQDDFNWSRNAGRNELYEHIKAGDRCSGRFTEGAQRYGVDDPGWSFAAGAADLDANGFPDLYVANDFAPDVLFLNVDGTRFEKVVRRYGIGHDTKKGMSVAFGDFNNSGRLGIYISNITEPGYLVEGNILWENLGGGPFRDVAWKTGAADGGWAWGSLFGDFSNDGHADIF